jgi:hypothetical protein
VVPDGGEEVVQVAIPGLGCLFGSHTPRLPRPVSTLPSWALLRGACGQKPCGTHLTLHTAPTTPAASTAAHPRSTWAANSYTVRLYGASSSGVNASGRMPMARTSSATFRVASSWAPSRSAPAAVPSLSDSVGKRVLGRGETAHREEPRGRRQGA